MNDVNRPVAAGATEDARRILRPSGEAFLFQPIALRSITARNRIMVSPMCEYSAEEGTGMPNDWHFVHLVSRAVGGAGIVCTEVTHVEKRGLITKHCLGLWNDAQRDAFAPIAAAIASHGAVPGIQIGHAGRKASVARPWEGGKPLTPETGAWTPIGPSPLPFAPGYPAPREMDAALIAEVLGAFRAAARRAREAGFKLIELHGAHGYLAHEFLSPLSNRRTDRYGGAIENRARFLLEIVAAVRTEWPAELPLFVRLSCTDWVPGGWDIEQTVALCRMLAEGGAVDLVDCSSGGLDPGQAVPLHPGYQVPFAERIRRDTGVLTGAVGLITTAQQADRIIRGGQADLVLLAREFLRDPYWPLHAAAELGVAAHWPPQYLRAAPRGSLPRRPREA